MMQERVNDYKREQGNPEKDCSTKIEPNPLHSGYSLLRFGLSGVLRAVGRAFARRKSGAAWPWPKDVVQSAHAGLPPLLRRWRNI